MKALAAKDRMAEAQKRIEEAQKNQGPPGLPTGFHDLDRRSGGLMGQELVALTGCPSIGKTTFALTIADYIARSSGAVLFFSLELAYRHIDTRLISISSWVRADQIECGYIPKDKRKQVLEEVSRHSESPLFVFDSVYKLDEICQESRYYAGCEDLQCIVIDSLTMIDHLSVDDQSPWNTRRVLITLKYLSQELDVPIVLVTPCNMSALKRRPPMPMAEDLWHHNEIFQVCDRVYSLYRDKFYDEDSDEDFALLDFLKDRRQSTGRIRIGYDDQNGLRFFNMAWDSP